MNPILNVLLGVLAAFSPFILVNIGYAIIDSMHKRKVMKTGDKKLQAQLLEQPSKRQEFSSIMKAALADQRLAGKKREIKIPDKNAIKKMEASGQTVTDENRPMKTLVDDGDRPQYEYSSEKWDPKFDQFADGTPDPIRSRIYVDPGKGAPTIRRRYFILMGVAIVLGVIMCFLKLWIGLLAPFILGCVTLAQMKKHGKECEASTELVWQKLTDIYTNCVGPLKDGQSIHDVVTINDWSALGDDQYEANAKTYAGEKGLTEDLEKILPKIDQKTGKKIKPRRAVFRDVPCSITIQFGTGFGLNESQRQRLLDNLNLNIGGGKVEWVAKKALPTKDGTLKQVDGWDFDKMTVDLMTLPPLPMMAALPEDIDETPWNVIRLGRAVDGEVVWDLSGQGWGYRPKMDENGKVLRDDFGMPIFPDANDPNKVPDTIHHAKAAGITCPMALVPLSVDTLVWTLVETDDETGEVIKDKRTPRVDADSSEHHDRQGDELYETTLDGELICTDGSRVIAS